MNAADASPPSYNLWADPWIPLERLDGRRETAGLEHTLLHAHDFAALDDPSPLVNVSIHRLLAAVLQAALRPQSTDDIATLWRDGAFTHTEKNLTRIAEFRDRHHRRFDLYSPDHPFLQSADIPLDSNQLPKAELKTIAYLAPEIPAAGVVHFRHDYEYSRRFCPACAAKGLVMIPAFATSGGRGIKPSINGVPPIYVLPGGPSLFHSLTLSLIAPPYQPAIASSHDTPWWEHVPVVLRGHELLDVGYIESLTFPARRVRLHPEQQPGLCSRCGDLTTLGVRTMIYEMGESRSKGAAVWFDPFVAYVFPKDKPPRPLRPQEGRVLWRDYAALFLQRGHKTTRRPAVLDQLSDLIEHHLLAHPDLPYPFQCVSLRTDGRMKMFEWEASGYAIPPALLSNLEVADAVQTAIDRAEAVERILTAVFRRKLGGSGRDAARHANLLADIRAAYWSELATPFRQLALQLLTADRATAADVWLDTITRAAERVFTQAVDTLGDDAANLRLRAESASYCRGALHAFVKDIRGD